MNPKETDPEEITKRQKNIIISNFIVAILLGVVLLILLNLGLTVDEEGFMCLNDPLGYGAGKLSEANDARFSCTCSLAKANSPIILFDQDGKEVIYMEDDLGVDYNLDFNFSDLLID